MQKTVFRAFAIMGAALTPQTALAHCPLCTIGAGVAAILASQLGVKSTAIGIFVGAAAVALGLWISRAIKKKSIPKQDMVFALASFLLTILPLKPLWTDYTSLYIAFAGEYGSLFNRTYIVNRFILGSVIGGLLLFLTPKFSRALTKIRNGKSFSYQGILLAFGLLLGASLVIQFALKI